MVPPKAALDDASGELLAVDRAEHVAASLAVHEAVEPHMVDPLLEVGVVEQRDRATDVVLVDMGDDEDLVAVPAPAHQLLAHAIP